MQPSTLEILYVWDAVKQRLVFFHNPVEATQWDVPVGMDTRHTRASGCTTWATRSNQRGKMGVPLGPGGTDCVVKMLTQEAETSLILMRPRATEVTPGAVANNKSVAARIVPSNRMPGASTGHGGATTRAKRCTVE